MIYKLRKSTKLRKSVRKISKFSLDSTSKKAFEITKNVKTSNAEILRQVRSGICD